MEGPGDDRQSHLWVGGDWHLLAREASAVKKVRSFPLVMAAVLVLLLGWTRPALADRAMEPEAALKTYGDWKVGCDTIRACRAIGLAPRDSATSGYVLVTRAGEAAAAPRVSVISRLDERFASPLRLSLTVDAAPVSGLSSASWPAVASEGGDSVRVDIGGADAVLLLARLATGKSLEVKVAGEGHPQATAVLSLTGASDALAHMDAVQLRTGTVTALVAPGTVPAATIPAVPSPPVVTSTQMVAILPPPEPLPPGVNPADPDDCAGARPPMVQVVRLSGGLELWGTCYARGSYNEQTAFWLVGQGPTRPATFPLPAGLSFTDAPAILENAVLSSDGHTLDSYVRGRGAGDCGAAIKWVWTGAEFKLADLAMMDDCRGVPQEDWPVVFRARWTRHAP
ncbi:MAG: DUF1176 domain-containing protein [Pseudomonadota bacterium]